MTDFYQQNAMNNGYLPGRALVQARGQLGGNRPVFVKLQRNGKDAQNFPSIGGKVVNPFRGRARAYAGTLAEYRIDGTIRILKTYAVAKGSNGTTIYLKRNGYAYRPFVGDNIMVAPNTLTGTGTAVTVTKVTKATDATAGYIWEVEVSATLGALTTTSILTEAEEVGADKNAVVTNPNSFFPCDYDFIFDPAADDDDFDGARYLISVALALGDTFMIEDLMDPLPEAVKNINASKVDGWFNF